MGRGVGGTGPSPRSATVTFYLYSKITLQSKLWTSKPTTIRLREIRSLDKSKTSRPCVLYPHISRRARSESGVKPVFCLAIFACHEVTAAIVRAIHPDLQTYKFNKGYLGYIVKPNRAQNFRLSNLRQKSTINNSQSSNLLTWRTSPRCESAHIPFVSGLAITTLTPGSIWLEKKY